MIWMLLLLSFLLFIYLKLYKPLKFWEERGVPHLKAFPYVGNLLPFTLGQTTFIDLMVKLYNSMDKRYFGIITFNRPVLFIKDINLVKQIIIKDFDHFVDHKSFFNETNEPVFSRNLFASKGQDWREMRVTLSPAFTGSKMRSMFLLISECADRFTQHFSQIIKDGKPLEIELKETYTRLTIDVIGTCVFGIESNSMKDENNDFYQIGKGVSNFAGIKALKSIGFLAMPSIMRFFKVRFFSDDQINFFRNIVSTTIAYREKHNIIRPDLIHLMMQARKGQLKYEESTKLDDAGFATISESDVGKDSSIKIEITDDVIVAQAMVFFLGGVDTNSSLLCFVSYELAVNPQIQEKLQSEIDAVYEECNEKVTYEAVTKMKYLDMVVCESLRKWPQGFFTDRLCVKDYTIKPTTPNEVPYTIRKGETVWIPIVGFHKDPKYFSDPDVFNPERFSDENKKNINSNTFMPFGDGPRSCIGNRFALLVIKTTLFYILQKFNFVVIEKTDIPLKLSKSQIIINAANGFWVGLQNR